MSNPHHLLQRYGKKILADLQFPINNGWSHGVLIFEGVPLDHYENRGYLAVGLKYEANGSDMKKDQQVELFREKCKALGLNVTPQRLAIYKALAGDETHPSPDAVFRRVRSSHPTISHATVYKTLDTFERHGIVSRLTPLHESVRYDPTTSQHHHIICVRCKKVVNLADDDLEAIQIPAQVSRDNKVLGYSVHFSVLCASCKERE